VRRNTGLIVLTLRTEKAKGADLESVVLPDLK
jgi:hypothetical protein